MALRLEHTVMQTELAGVLPVHKGEFQAIQQSALRWSNRLKQAVAVCNSLTMVNKNTVVGMDMERRMFKAVEARFLVCPPGLLANTARRGGHLAMNFVVKRSVKVLGLFADGETSRCGKAARQMYAMHGAALCKPCSSSKLCMSRGAEDFACIEKGGNAVPSGINSMRSQVLYRAAQHPYVLQPVCFFVVCMHCYNPSDPACTFDRKEAVAHMTDMIQP